ncbi:hypothetical protein [Ornithinimicrobium panacihumi]|uniref:hypothetical protein n=1 Tax=Ornithinimicrobium panacihumi TaxID=2008449 RepID=UPI003F8A73E7
MHRTARFRTLAMAGALSLALTACGGDTEEPTTPATEASTADDRLAPPDQDAEQNTQDAGSATGDDTSDDASAGAGAGDSASTEDADAATGDDSGDGGTVAGDVPPLEEVWPQVMDNVESAESVDVTMGGVMDGEELEVTLRGQLDDSNYEANVVMAQGEVSIVKADGSHFVQGDETFWAEAGGPGTESLAGTWVQIPEDMGFADAFSMASLWEDFISEIPRSTSDLQTYSAVLTDLDGEPAYHYSISTEDAEIWVAAEGEPYLLKVELGDSASNGAEQLRIEAKDWDAVEAIEAPEDATPIEEVLPGAGGSGGDGGR